MALDRLTKIDGGGISTTSDYRVGVITATKFVGPIEGAITSTDATFTGNVSIGGTLTYEDVTNIDSIGIVTARNDIHIGAGVSAVGVGTFGSLDIGGDIDVDGHTNLDNVSIAGVSTFNDDVTLTGVSGGTSGSAIWDYSDKSLNIGNNAFLKFGSTTYSNGQQLQIYQAGSVGFTIFKSLNNNQIAYQNDRLFFNNQANNTALARIESAEGVSLYYTGTKRLQTSGIGVTVTGTVVATGADINGDLDVDGHTNLDNVSVAGISTFSKNIILPDSTDATDGRVKFGATNDMMLFHYGGANYIDVTTNLNIRGSSSGNTISIKPKSAEEGIKIIPDGAVELYHDGTKKIETTANGLKLPDSTRIDFGDSLDLKIYHHGGNSVIDTDTGDLILRSDADDVKILAEDGIVLRDNDDSTNFVNCINGGAVELFHNGSKKFETTSSGGTLTGSLTVTDDIYLSDANVAYFGTNNDMRIYHSGTHGYIKNTVNNLYFMTTNSKYGALMYANGAVELRYDNVKKFETTSSGVDISGDLVLPSSGQNLKIWTGGTQGIVMGHGGTYGEIDNLTGTMVIKAGSVNLANRFGNHNFIYCNASNSVDLYYDAANHSTPKLKTSATGITVDGEVAASQDYPNFRPVLDFNFAATKKLKPEMTFTRQGEASFHDGVGSVKFVSDNEPRFEHDIVTGECKGLMFEQAGTNYSWYSRRFDVSATASWIKVTGNLNVVANSHNAPDGTSSGDYMADTVSGANGNTFNGNVLRQQITAGANVKHTFSIYIKLLTSTQATIYIRDGATGSTSTANAISNTRNWQRVVVTSNNALTNGTAHSFYIGNTNGDIAVWGSQIERSDYVTSYIKTEGGANGTRTADNGGVRLDGEDVTDVFNQGEGTLIAEAIPTNSITNQGLVGFYQDFGSVNRIEVRTQGSSGSTANARFESVVGSSSVVTNTSSPHAGINNVSKYAFAFQENNYASTVNGGTVQTDTNGAFPHGTGINSMIIGDSVYSQDTSVIVKRIMYYADRLPNSQLVTLTS